MIPHIVIVGRANVGKSTLFNRIARRRVVITFSESGTTRDRIKVKSTWRGYEFFLTDTGGFITDKKENFFSLASKVNQQILEAIRGADVVIFLVDGSGEPTIEDVKIAELLRKEKRVFLLAVNKIDRKETQFNLPSYYRLGAEEVVPISAEHGIGVDILLDKIFEKLPKNLLKQESSEENRVLKLLIAGRPNVGKSTFLNTLLGQERAIVSPIPGTTRDAIEEEFIFENRKVRIIDTAGIRKRSKIKSLVEYFSIKRALKYISNSDVIILLLDGELYKENLLPLTKQDLKILEFVMNHGKGAVIAINKVDLIPKKVHKDLINAIKVNLRAFDFVPVASVSALKGYGLKELVKTAFDVYEEGRKIISDELLETTVIPVLKNRLPSFKTKRIAIKQVSTLPPKFYLIVNNPQDVSEQYLRFVANELRNYFGFIGNPIEIKAVKKY
ncbi:MAG: ribosome biogenesis GTPase Der [candidate division WOR-3 bacterium]|nr:ribosome biogenesis GTPase Der [candidate division WOR-3 bacterium]MDW7987508.1 ribosome biogenesis GTPase Der [candidate division WOR-3 bacterium]